MPGQFRAKFVAETPRTNPTKQGLLSGGTMELAPGFRVDIKYMTMGQYYMHTRVSTDTYTHIHIHTHIHTHIHAHAHTHTHHSSLRSLHALLAITSFTCIVHIDTHVNV